MIDPETQELHEEFVLESTQNLADIEQDILQLEESGVESELINRIFRAIHSMKGTSGYLQLANIGKVSHLTETLLDQIRKEEREATSDCIDMILDSVDALRSMVESDDLGEGRDVSAIIERLDTLVNGGKEEIVDIAPLSTDETAAVLRDLALDRETLQAAIDKTKDGMSLFRVLLRPDHRDQHDDLKNGVADTFALFGTIIHSSVPLDRIDSFQGEPAAILFVSVLDREMVLTAFGIERGDCIDISRDAVDVAMQDEPDLLAATAPAAAPKPASAPEPVAAAPKPAAPAPKPAPQPAAAPVAKKEEKPAAPAKKGNGKNGKNSKGGEMMKINSRFLDDLLRLTGNMVMARNQMLTRYNFHDDAAFATLSQAITEVHHSVVQTRMETVASLFDRFRRVVRDLSKQLGKKIELYTEGGEIELDRTILESFTDPMTHMVRNCVDHAIETPDERIDAGKSQTGTVTLRAYHESGEIIIEVEDDGRGIDAEKLKVKGVEKGLIDEAQAERMSEKQALDLLFMPGFSTAEKVSDVSGRGVGMDVVRTNIEKIGGTVDLETRLGQGTKFMARLPLTQALVSSSLISAVVMRLGEDRFAVPETAVNELIRVAPRDREAKIKFIQGQEVFQHREIVLPIIRIEDALRGDVPSGADPADADDLLAALDETAPEEPAETPDTPQTSSKPHSQILVVLQFRQNLFGILVDAIIGIEEIVVRESPKLVKNATIFSGHTVLGDGQVVMIIDINGLIEKMKMRFIEQDEESIRALAAYRRSDRQTMIIFNFADEEYFAIPLDLVNLIEKIDSSEIRKVGTRQFFPFKNSTIPLLYLDHHLPVTPIDRTLPNYNLILPARMEYPIGLLTGSYLQVVEVSERFDSKITDEKGILGTFMHEDKLIMLLDLYALFEHDDPEHFDTARKGESKPARILFAEDSMFYRRLGLKYMEAPGRQITVANDGQEAFEKLLGNPDAFDLVVSDIEMPNMNGFQLIQKIRAEPALQAIPAIALTSLSDEQSREKGIRYGFNEYVVKVDKDGLIRAVNKYAAMAGERQSLIGTGA